MRFLLATMHMIMCHTPSYDAPSVHYMINDQIMSMLMTQVV